MKAIFILLDSLNRRVLPFYNPGADTILPNMQRLADRGVIFEQHWCGSAPCMPARRDILTGRINFLERPWGGIEPFDQTLPSLLSSQNVYSHLVTDHFHYAERGGENYWANFTSWYLERGAEHDTVHWGPDQTGIPHPECPADLNGIFSPSYEATKSFYNGETSAYSTPRTLKRAADWLECYAQSDNFFLWVEGFDPHEPFDVPRSYLELYGLTGDEDVCASNYWPPYAEDICSDRERFMYRRRYQALCTMTDQYLGELLDVMDRHDLWKDTLVILTTDHGYMLGEHGFWAKNYMPDYNEVFHIPMIAAMPGVPAGRFSELTQNIDLFPTLLAYFRVDQSLQRNPIHGRNLLPVLRGEDFPAREGVIFGTYGKTVGITDGKCVYIQEPQHPEKNEPLYIYGSTMTLLNQYIGYDSMSDGDISQIGFGKLSWTAYPVYKVPAAYVHWNNESERFDRINRYADRSRVYDLETDYSQTTPIYQGNLMERYQSLLVKIMQAHDAPTEQFERLGLKTEYVEIEYVEMTGEIV